MAYEDDRVAGTSNTSKKKDTGLSSLSLNSEIRFLKNLYNMISLY